MADVSAYTNAIRRHRYKHFNGQCQAEDSEYKKGKKVLNSR